MNWLPASAGFRKREREADAFGAKLAAAELTEAARQFLGDGD
jgi:hypothetical protein